MELDDVGEQKWTFIVSHLIWEIQPDSSLTLPRSHAIVLANGLPEVTF